jgi:hypothetical protein
MDMKIQETGRTSEEIEAELEGMQGELDLQGGEGGEPSPAEALEAELAAAEDQATRQGWMPKDQYKGDPKKWVDAKTFVERGERFVTNLQQEVAALRKELQDFQGTKAAFIKFHEESMEKKATELTEAISTLRIQRSEAQRDGDDEVVIQIEDRIELLKDQQKELKAPIKQEAAPTAPAKLDMDNPVLNEWITDGNEWFRDEPKLRDYSIAVGEHLMKEGETARGRAFLDKVTAVMQRDFPRRFKSTGSSFGLGNATSGSGNVGGRSASVSGKTVRDLPEEDRALMKQFIKEGWTTEEKFLASYFK